MLRQDARPRRRFRPDVREVCLRRGVQHRDALRLCLLHEGVDGADILPRGTAAVVAHAPQAEAERRGIRQCLGRGADLFMAFPSAVLYPVCERCAMTDEPS